MKPRFESRRRAPRALRGALAALATVALAAGAALLPSTAYASDYSFHLHGTVEGLGDIGLSNGRYTSSSWARTGTEDVAAGTSTTWEMTATDPKMSFEYRIVERGAPTKYWIVGEAHIDSGFWADASCAMWREKADGSRVQVDQETASPYVCVADGGSFTDQTGTLFKVHSQTWSTVRGIIQPVNSEFDTVALADGTIDSENADLVVNGATHTAESPLDQIDSGSTTKIAAFLRNTEGGELTHKANFYFAYQIIEDGYPTAYWVTGHAENVRGVGFQHTSVCNITLGKPGDGGVTAAFSPYTCKMIGENLSGRADWQVTFKVGVHAYTPVTGLEAQDLIKKGCTAGDAKCVYVMTNHEGTTGDRQLVGQQNNDTDVETEMKVTWVETRGESNSIDTSVTLETETKFWIGTFKTAFKLAYGHEWTYDSTHKWEHSSPVEAHHTASFYLSPAYEKITGDYFLLYNGKYYRAVDATFTLPLQIAGPGAVTIESVPYSGTSTDAQPSEAVPTTDQPTGSATGDATVAGPTSGTTSDPATEPAAEPAASALPGRRSGVAAGRD